MAELKTRKFASYTEAMIAVMDEVDSARRRYPVFNSAHEGYAVLLEEVDELWEEVRAKPEKRSGVLLRTEAIQIAAMALCFAVEVNEE